MDIKKEQDVEKVQFSELIEKCKAYMASELSQEEFEAYCDKIYFRTYLPLEDKISILNKFAAWLDGKVEKHKGQIEKYGYLGVVLFVGIPIPGTGAWTGSLIASVLELDRKKTFVAVLIGILLASIIMMLVSFGILGNIIH